MPSTNAGRPLPQDSQFEAGLTPSYKRRRTALACTSCRNRKSRCNGAKPSCSLCVELGFECIYQQPAVSHGKASEPESGYDQRLRAIEDTLRLLVQQKEESVVGSSPRQRVSFRDNPDPSNRSTNSEQPPHDDDEDLAILEEDNLQATNAGDDTVDGMATITDVEEPEKRFFGPSSNITFLRHISDATSAILKAIGQSRYSENGIAQPIVSRAVSPVPTISEATPSTRSSVNIRSIPSEERALHLIELFFSDTGMLFPYISQGELLRTYKTARQNRFTAVSRSWLCLLNMIFAFATYISAKPHQPAEKNAAESEIFVERAQALAADMELKTASLETVQCLLLMSQYHQGTQRSDQAWNLHGMAVRAGIQLGLHSRSASIGLSALETEIRKRTWYGCILLDRTLSMTFGRPAHIPNEYIKLDLPSNQNLEELALAGTVGIRPDALDRPDTVWLFTSTIQLYKILGEIISDLYGSNIDTDPQLEVPTMVERTFSLELRLSNWKQNLIPQLQRRPWVSMNGDEVIASTWDPIFDRLSVINNLRYLNTRILLHRPVLSALLRKRAKIGSSDEYPEDHELFFVQLGEHCIKICENSAMEIVDVVHSTSKPPSLLGAWWFTTYYTFNAALVIFSCILLEITSDSFRQNGSKLPSSINTNKIIDMIRQLRQAAEALQRFGGATRSARRIRKTVLKLVQISITLTQSYPEYGPAVLAALYPRDSNDWSENIVPQATTLQAPGVDMRDQALGTDGLATTLGPDDPFLSFDMGVHQYWIDPNLDLFSDLVGNETGMTAFMTG